MDTLVDEQLTPVTELQCYHCGEPCREHEYLIADKHFCCQGCKMVYEVLSDHHLENFYTRRERTGTRQRNWRTDRYAALEQEEMVRQLLDFREGSVARITLRLPQIHCTACIWLLERLYKLDPGIQNSQVNFLRKEAYITFNIEQISLRKLAELLARIGYAPDFNLGDLAKDQKKTRDWNLLYQLGVAGFAFGNSMLLSFPEYLGLDHLSESYFRSVFGYLNLGLALPVVLYSARDYWWAALANLRTRTLTIDVPISLGIFTLFIRSAWEIMSQSGAGYLDSLTGLVFFLLIGKWFQQKTYYQLSFERDYQSYFPIAVRLPGEGTKAVKELKVGDRILIRHGELLPADGLLLAGNARMDYSFVSGEAVPVRKEEGEQLYAGGKQQGGQILVEINRPVQQSYLTRLWDQEAFRKDKEQDHVLTTNKMGRYFTLIILSIALISLLFWLTRDTGMAVNVFTAVLIIACPCAIALSVPFTLGSALRILGRSGLYLKNTHVIERLQEISCIVFDKTGTLTKNRQKLGLDYRGTPLSDREKEQLAALCRQSNHPMAGAILAWTGSSDGNISLTDFKEITGKGISGNIGQHQIHLGSADFLAVEPALAGQAQVFLRIDGAFIGSFTVHHDYRNGMQELIERLGSQYELFLLSGDNEREGQFLSRYFTTDHLHFRQRPEDKLAFIRSLQQQGRKVLMIGDGLNDAGALRQSEVGLVIAEDTNNFTPASDAILDAGRFERIPDFLSYARTSNRLVIYAYVLAIVYNIIGLSFAVQGLLSPVIAAILMPLSSITIVTFGVLSSRLLAYHYGLSGQSVTPAPVGGTGSDKNHQAQ